MTCGAYIGDKPGDGKQGITHGICDPCFYQARRDVDNDGSFVLPGAPPPTTEG